MSNIAYIPESVARLCSESFNMPFEPIYECARNKRGNDLLYKMGVLTLGLNPQLNYVPWINVNDIHTNENQFEAERVDLVQLICKNYKGCGRPSICNNQDDVSCNVVSTVAIEETTTKKVENSGNMIRFNFALIFLMVFIFFF